MAPLLGLSSFTGSLEVTSTEPIVSLSIHSEAAPVFSSLPPGELEAAAPAPVSRTLLKRIDEAEAASCRSVGRGRYASPGRAMR